MSQSYEILKELADMIVSASIEERILSDIEHEYFDIMFEKALQASSSDNSDYK